MSRAKKFMDDNMLASTDQRSKKFCKSWPVSKQDMSHVIETIRIVKCNDLNDIRNHQKLCVLCAACFDTHAGGGRHAVC